MLQTSSCTTKHDESFSVNTLHLISDLFGNIKMSKVDYHCKYLASFVAQCTQKVIKETTH